MYQVDKNLTRVLKEYEICICSVLLVVSIYVLISRPKIELVEFLFVALHLFILYACLRAFSGVCVCGGVRACVHTQNLARVVSLLLCGFWGIKHRSLPMEPEPSCWPAYGISPNIRICLLCQGVSVFSWLKNYSDTFGSYTTYSLM